MSQFQEFMSALRSGNVEQARQLYSTMVPTSGSETLAMGSRQEELLADRSPEKWREDAATATRRAGANRAGASLITGDNALGIGAVDIAAPTAIPAAVADFRETREGVRRGEVGPGEYGAMAAAIPLSFLGLGAAAKGVAKTAGKSVDNMASSMRRLFSRAAPEEGAVARQIEAEQPRRTLMGQEVPNAVRMPDDLTVGEKLAVTNREREVSSVSDIEPERALQYSREQPAMYHGVRDGTEPVYSVDSIDEAGMHANAFSAYVYDTPTPELDPVNMADSLFGKSSDAAVKFSQYLIDNHAAELDTIRKIQRERMSVVGEKYSEIMSRTNYPTKDAELTRLLSGLSRNDETLERLKEGLEEIWLATETPSASLISPNEFRTLLANLGIDPTPTARQQVEKSYNLGAELRQVDYQLQRLTRTAENDIAREVGATLAPIRDQYLAKVNDGRSVVDIIQQEGFRKGRSAEANMAGTSLSPDPTVSMRPGFAGGDTRNMLAVNTGDISVDDVRPQDYLTRNYEGYQGEAINKPNAFSEDETFFRADTGGQQRLTARELSPEEGRYVARSQRAVDDAMNSASNLKASGIIRPGDSAQAQRTYNSFRNLIQDIAKLKQFGRGGAEKATRDLLGRVETIAAIDGDPRMAKAAEDFIAKLGPSQQKAFREFWSDLQTAATMNRQARTLSDVIKDNKYERIISGERKFNTPTLQDLGVNITPELQKDIDSFMSNKGVIPVSLRSAIKDGYDRFFTQATHARRKLLQHSDKLALMLTAAGAATAGGNTAEAAPSLAEMDAAAVLPNGPILDEFKGIQDMINAARDEDKINDPATLRAIRARHRELLSKLIDDAVEE